MVGGSPALRAYATLWCFAQIVEWWFGSLSRQGPYEWTQLLIIVAALLSRSRAAFLMALAARVAGFATRVPAVFDAEYFAALTDLAVLVLAGLGMEEWIGPTVRGQLSTFYVWAGFHKLNTGFLDPVSSCASVYGVQIADALGVPSLAPLAFRIAAPATLAIELGIGVCLAVAPLVGVILAVVLHTGIALTPPPNNIAGFGVVCATRCFWVRGGSSRLEGLSLAAAFAAILLGLTRSLHVKPTVQFSIAPSLDYPAGVYGATAAVALAACWRRARPPNPRGAVGATIAAAFVAAMSIWCVVPVVLGILDGGSPNMFSNLRMFGGTNHLAGLPTGLLQAWKQDDPASVFSGGILRVEDSNSTHLNAVHPAEITSVLTESAVDLLRGLGHPGRFFNPTVATVVGTAVIPHPRFSDPFTLPAFELARVLAATRDTPVRVVYSRLHGPRGDEQWRRSAHVDYTVELVFSGFPHVHACTVLRTGNESYYDPCGADLFFLPYLHGPNTLLNRLGRALQYWNSQIILPDPAHARNLPCYGS